MRRRFHPLAQLAFALAALIGPASAAHGDPIVVRDATGQEVTINDNSRIVSIGGAITEILYALGLEQHVVAIDSTSFHPPQALRDKPNVGYVRALSPEGVIGLNPSLILAAEDAGPKETIAVLRAAGIPFVLVPDKYNGKSILEKIEIVSTAAGGAERGACLAKAVAADLDALAKIRAHVDHPVKAAFLLSFVNDRAMVAGRATAADGIIALAGATNAINEYEGYKPINDEAIIAAKPEFVLAMRRDSHPLDAQTVFAHPGFALTPAAKRQGFVAMNALYLLGFGPRTALAARDLAATLYPALSAGKLPSEQDEARVRACRG
ncbi:MAG: ABC transporter substrate-binding protein [Rhizobiales bacterium]|nr:ABC transporter substrate-binding protein [Hyphomicrobiales bacterium]